MKNAIILHGTGSTPNSFWHPSIKTFLEKLGYTVWVPQLPEANTPKLQTQLPFILNDGQFNNDTVLIGHSAGCPLLLSVLENISVKVSKAVLVSGYARAKGDFKEEPILQATYNWKKIKENADDITYINSDNDPWGCNDEEGLYMWKRLGGTLILREGDGHMGSEKFKQPYTNFPLLEKLLGLRVKG